MPVTTAPGSRTRGSRPIAREAFDSVMKGPNQLGVSRADVNVGAADLLQVPDGAITEAGLRGCIRVGVQYLEAWLRGNGCVPLYHLMEDAATAEICRAQLWQWLRHGARTSDGQPITIERFDRLLSAGARPHPRRGGRGAPYRRGVPDRGAPFRADDQGGSVR